MVTRSAGREVKVGRPSDPVSGVKEGSSLSEVELDVKLQMLGRWSWSSFEKHVEAVEKTEVFRRVVLGVCIKRLGDEGSVMDGMEPFPVPVREIPGLALERVYEGAVVVRGDSGSGDSTSPCCCWLGCGSGLIVMESW